MNPISLSDNSIYSDLQLSFDATSGRNAPASAKKQSYDSSNIAPKEVDLSNYYNDVPPPSSDLLSQAGQNVTDSARNLEDVMINALANGYTVQDVCNIKCAETAYKANCNVFKTTFEVSV